MPDSPADVKTQARSSPPSMPPPAAQGASRHPSFTPSTNRDAGPPTFLPRGRFHGCLKWSMVCLLMNGSSHSPTAINGAPSTPNGFSNNSTLTIEEFHAKLQEATNFPLRPFVIPFLKATLPLLQRELLHCARMAKQTPAQYLAQHEQLLLDANASSLIDSSELLLEVGESGKRRTPDRTKENGLDRDPLHPEHLSKRPCTMSPAQRYSPSNGLSHPPNGLGHRLRPLRVPAPLSRGSGAAGRGIPGGWHLLRASPLSLADAHRDFAPRPLSGYMPEEIWRKAEEAVNEVKRQAMSELQKAVSDAERKAHELITTERAKMERALAEAKRQASEDALTVINQQEDSSESCWNCGRKASETCSGCNTARYCGSFCQHKDWEKHHHVCGQTLQVPLSRSHGLTAPRAISSAT
ncbi:protein CBFA2T3 [Geospiza fortis]|uniref:Protein CBFA2T3 n=1 Tax=Geospiza fortis TaxID=48883 RepID=A0A8N5ERT9_GEOFO|nr:protein CBFA2T3 [Geospiza fortis]